MCNHLGLVESPYPKSTFYHTYCTHSELPITFLQSYLNKIQAIITTFIWKGKHPRIKKAIMCTPTSAGEMGAPIIKAYFKAIILDQARIWWKPASQHTWLQIERTVLFSCYNLHLSALLLSHQGTHTPTLALSMQSSKCAEQLTSKLRVSCTDHYPLSP